MNGETRRTPWGKGRVIFLANMERFKDAAAKGWPFAHIYRENQDILEGISYSQFYHWARRYLSSCSRMPDKPKFAQTESGPMRAEVRSKRFVHNNNPDPKDLI